MLDAIEADRLASARAEMRARGFLAVNCEPPWFRLLLRLGVTHRPPHYRRFWSLTLDMGLFFAVLWGAFSWSEWRAEGMAPRDAILTSTAIGLAFGVTMAIWYGLSARRHKLSRWEDLGRPSAAKPAPNPA